MTVRACFINRQQPPPWLLYCCLLCSSEKDCSIFRKNKKLKLNQHQRLWLWGFFPPHWFSRYFMKSVSSKGWNLRVPFHPILQGWALPARSTFLTLICRFMITCPIQGKGWIAFWEAQTGAIALPCRNPDSLKSSSPHFSALLGQGELKPNWNLSLPSVTLK